MKTRTGCQLVLYRRVSSDKQGRSGLGLEAQHSSVVNYAERNACSIIGEFIEVESGKKNDRPELAKAIAFAKRKKATLVIARLDRLARRVHFISGLMESGVDFFAVDAPDDEPFILHVKASFAEEEARKISQRTKAALAAAKARGVILGRPENLTAEAQAKGAASNRNEAIAAYALIAPLAEKLKREGLSLAAIAARLNELGHATRKGSAWSAMTVKRLLDRLTTS